MQTTHETIGPLDVTIVDAGSATRPEMMVVLCHGYGAPGTDLVPLAEALVATEESLQTGVRFVFPAAPDPIPGLEPFGSRMWWPLDVQDIYKTIQEEGFEVVCSRVPEGLSRARRKVRAMLEELRRETDLPMSKIVLGGFSQGSMLMTDLTLRLAEAPAALVILSGALIASHQWEQHAPRRRGLPVIQAHGRGDEVLAPRGAEMMKDLLAGAGLDVEYIEFEGGHTVDRAVIDRVARLLASVRDQGGD